MSSPAMAHNRRLLLRMLVPKPIQKPYPIRRDLLRKQLPDDLTNIQCPLSQIRRRVSFFIHDVCDLDNASKHARLAMSKRIDPKDKNSIFSCKLIISEMCTAGLSSDAFDLFHFFYNESKLKPDIATCNLMIKSQCEQGLVDDAFVLYNHLHSFGPYPSNITYDILSKALVDVGMMDKALELWLRARGHLYDPGMYMNLINGFLEQGNLHMAYGIRDEFKTCSTRNYVSILNSVFVEYLFKQGNDEEAMELYKTSLNNNGFTANSSVGNPYLKLLLKYGQKTQAWSLFHYMLDNYHSSVGLREDTLNIMVDECIEMGQFKDAVNIFLKTKAKLVHLDLVGYKHLITKLCQNGKLSEAETVFDELVKEECCKPDAQTYTALIHAYIKSQRLEDAIQTVNKMVDDNLRTVTNLLHF